MEINFENLQAAHNLTFIGRSGTGKCAGVFFGITHNKKRLTLTPLTSKGSLAKCDFDIPLTPEVVQQFKDFLDAALLQVEPKKEIVVIIGVKQLVKDEELDFDDREENIPGTYEVKVPFTTSLHVAVSIALDTFAESVPIAVLEDFEITGYINGEEVDQSDDTGYSHRGEGAFIGKISDELPEYSGDPESDKKPDFLAFLISKGIDASDLDELVDETISSAGPSINNEGVSRQVEFLLSQGVTSHHIASVLGVDVEWADILDNPEDYNL